MFGEGPADRRERLRNVLDSKSFSEEDISLQREILGLKKSDRDEDSGNKETVYTRASPTLIEARKKIYAFSLERYSLALSVMMQLQRAFAETAGGGERHAETGGARDPDQGSLGPIQRPPPCLLFRRTSSWRAPSLVQSAPSPAAASTRRTPRSPRASSRPAASAASCGCGTWRRVCSCAAGRHIPTASAALPGVR